jgi:hypothetical protein
MVWRIDNGGVLYFYVAHGGYQNYGFHCEHLLSLLPSLLGGHL